MGKNIVPQKEQCIQGHVSRRIVCLQNGTWPTGLETRTQRRVIYVASKTQIIGNIDYPAEDLDGVFQLMGSY